MQKNCEPTKTDRAQNHERTRRWFCHGEELTNAVAALARPKVYETVLAAVRERVGENPA